MSSALLPVAVGDVYYDSQVTQIKKEIMDRGSMIRHRSIITLKNRMVLTVDNYEKKNKAADDDKPPQEEKAPAKEKEPAKKVEKVVLEAAATAATAPMIIRKEEEDTWKPLPVWVYSVAAHPIKPKKRPSRKKPRAVWHLVAANEQREQQQQLLYPDRDCWKPQDVLIYAPGKDLPEDHDPGLPTGVWGYAPDSQPADDTGGDGDEYYDWRPVDAQLLQPNMYMPDGGAVAPPSDFTAEGVYTYDPDSLVNSREWPPPIDEAMKQRKDKEEDDSWKPELAWVYPRAKTPQSTTTSTADDDDDDEWRPQGVWTYDNKNPHIDDSHWKPQEVWMYPSGKETETIIDNESSIIRPHGVWGLSPDAKEDENGNWKPEDMWFYVPGETPADEDSWKPQGVWTYPPNKQLKIEWPPPMDDCWKPQSAWVFPKRKAPEQNPDDSSKQPQGIWKYNRRPGYQPTTDEDDDDWDPKEVWIYPRGVPQPNMMDLDDSKSHGIWGLAPDAGEPDDRGHWKVESMWFYAPGENPPNDDDWLPQGVWTYPPGKLDYEWPPPPPKKDASSKSSSSPIPGKLKIPITFGKHEEFLQPW
jgi:hypothetical protein